MASLQAPAATVPHHIFEVPANHGMKDLDRSKFACKTKIPAILVRQPALVQGFVRELSKILLHAPRFPNVVAPGSDFGTLAQSDRPDLAGPESSGYRLILCRPEEEARIRMKRFVDDHPDTDVLDFEISLGYDYWPAEQVLASVLPKGTTVPTSFEQIGHIAHFNLREEHEEFKQIIGQVILDKNRTLRTVVNKANTIDDTYRTFQMEIVAGEPDMLAEMRESSCTFKFDFSKVYWNSRLQGEHDRIIRMFQPGQYICDVFAGVGPFAVPAGKIHKCAVYANDLNPSSYAYLVDNIRGNKVEGLVLPFCMDGRDFIRSSLRLLNDPTNRETISARRKADAEAASITLGKIEQTSGKGSPAKRAELDPAEARQKEAEVALNASSVLHRTIFDHYVMNLPATAVEFLDAFRGLLAGSDETKSLQSTDMPTIHVHCFSKANDIEADVLEQISTHLGHRIDKDSPELLLIHRVRDVAPNKEMMCVSFRLPLEVARQCSDV